VGTKENQTRFLSRWLADYDPTLINKIAYNLFLEPVGFVMGRKMLIGTRQRLAPVKCTGFIMNS
jgi:hypothetical protein